MREPRAPAGAAVDALRAANDAFYAAFETLDIERMAAVWDHGAEVRCVHPGWRMLAGWDDVRRSWAQIFARAQCMQFVVRDVDARVEGGLGWVTCQENIVQTAGNEPSYGTVYATNIFKRAPDGWRMIVHHASPVAPGV